jgi:hypothetical protein
MATTIALSTVAGIYSVAVLTLVLGQFTPGSFGWVSSWPASSSSPASRASSPGPSAT